MINLGSIESLVALFVLGLGPGSGIYFVVRWALRGLEQLQVDFKAMITLYSDLRERVTLVEHRTGILEGRLTTMDQRILHAEATLHALDRRDSGAE